MGHPPRFQVVPQPRLPTDLEELGRRIDLLPEPHRQDLRPFLDRIAESFLLRTRIMNVAREALERIRLEVACMQFDLEVTRREKEALQKQLEDG